MRNYGISDISLILDVLHVCRFFRTAALLALVGCGGAVRSPPHNTTILLDSLLEEYDHRLRPNFGGKYC